MSVPRRHTRLIACFIFLNIIFGVFISLLWLPDGRPDTLPTKSSVMPDFPSPPITPQSVVDLSVAHPAPLAVEKAQEQPSLSTDKWMERYFPGSRILEQRETARDASGKWTREFLLHTDFKYPFVEVTEHLERDFNSGADVARGREVFVADHLLLKLQPGHSVAALQKAMGIVGATVDSTHLAETGVVRVQLGKGTLGAVRTACAQITGFRDIAVFAEPDHLYFAAVVPNDPSYGQQSGLNNVSVAESDIDAERGWDIATSAANLRVAVIDTGVRYTHQDLHSNIWQNEGDALNGIDDDHDGWIDNILGVNFYGNNVYPDDDSGHGTHVAGILGAAGNNARGIAGVAWSVQVMALKFQNQNGIGTASDAVRAINFAVSKGAHLINASWGGFGASQTLLASIAAARDADVLFVAAAGNDGWDTDVYPQYPSCFDLDNIISVGALSGAARNTGSNYGSQSVDLFAPGTEIFSLGKASDSDYVMNSGTSMAAPFVTGVLALLKNQNPSASSAWLKGRLLDTTSPLLSLRDRAVTDGRANLYTCLSNIIRAEAAITLQPSPASADSGTEETFSVAATGGGSLRYQWYHGSTLLQGKTSAILTLSNLTDADAGEYHVVVSNYVSSVASEVAILTVKHSPPTRVTSPLNLVALAGQPVDFSASFKGSRPVQFQWERDGVPIPGATSALFSVDNAQPEIAGEYRVKATNAYGSEYSAAARLSFVEHHLEKWMQTLPVPTSAYLSKVAYVNNGFVALGDAGTIVTSATGSVWELTIPATSEQLRGVAYGQGRYVAVGMAGTIVTSTDGRNWVAVNSGTTSVLGSVAISENRFVALSATTAYTSSDGLQWAAQSIGNATRLQQIAFGNGIFVATSITDSNTLQTWSSVDAVNWTAHSFGTFSTDASVSFSGGLFWLGDGSGVFSSTDGMTWTQRRGIPGTDVIASGNQLYSLFGYSIERVPLDEQGNATQVYTDINSSLTSLASGGGRIVAVGFYGRILCSDDGLSFRDVTRFTNEGIAGLDVLDGLFVTCGHYGKIFTSPDGIMWTQTAALSLGTGWINGMAIGNDMIVVIDSEGNLWTSTNAVQWAKHASPVSNSSSTYSISFHGDSFWLGGRYRSIDGVNWAPVQTTPTIFGGGRYLHLENFGTCLWSDDGLTWQRSNFPPEYTGPICYAHGIFYLLTQNKLMTSANGIDWTATAIQGWPENDRPTYSSSMAYRDGVFITSGHSHSYLSLDGVRWAAQSAPDFSKFVQSAGLIIAQGISTQSSLYRAVGDAPPQPPTAITGGITGLGNRGCVLSGLVNAEGAVTSAVFEYGTTTALGQTLTLNGSAEGRRNQLFNATLTGLQPSTEYFYRIVATNSVGTVAGQARRFTTLANRTPSPRNDGPFIRFDTLPQSIAVLANDTDPDGDAIHLVRVTQGQHGTTTIAGGSVSYVPVAGFSGRDEFTYTMADEFGAEAVATVFVSTYPRPSVVVTKVAVMSGEDAPGAGTVGGPPAGTKLVNFGTPALSDIRQLAAVTTLGNGKRRFGGVLYVDEAGAKSLPAFVGSAAGNDERFQSFLNPVLSTSGKLAFIAKSKAASPGRRGTKGVWSVWSNAMTRDGSLAAVLRTGEEILGPGGDRSFTVTGITTVAFDGETLYAVAQINSRRTALVRIDSSGPVLILWEGKSIEPGTTIKDLTVFTPAQGSAGTGRWIGDDGLIVRTTLSDRSAALYRVNPDGLIDKLLSTSSTQFTSLGLPSYAGNSDFTMLATLSDSSARSIAFTDAGSEYSIVEPGAIAPGAQPARFAGFEQPIRSAAGIAFAAKLRGSGVSSRNDSGVWWGEPTAYGKLARLSEPAPGVDGTPSDSKWAAFTSLALPRNSASGPIILGKVRSPREAAVPGLWAVDSKGLFRHILAAGEHHFGDVTLNVAKISTLNADAGSFGVGRSYNETGSVAVRVTTTTGAQALLRLDIP